MARRTRKPIQHELRFRSWGGRRPGAGRPRKPGAGVSHLRRPQVAARHPVHVTLKLRREIGSLRTKAKAKTIRQAMAQAVARGFAVVDWSIQGDHVHLTAEPGSTAALCRHVRGLSIRIARGLNRLLGRKGAVFADRYHVHVLTTPREVRHARAYVLLNARRHAAQRGRVLPVALDPYSSWAWFDGWAKPPPGAAEGRAVEGSPSAVAPQTWLMRVGWRRHGLVRTDEIPGSWT